MKSQRPFVRIDRITKTYGEFRAVDEVSLDIAHGEFLTFLGPSGSGKTTTLSIMAGFTDPTSGDILVDGQSLTSIPPHDRNIGMVFQRYTLFPHMSVAENVGFPLSVRGRTKSDIAAAVGNALDMVRLESFAARRPAELSGGQQQRVALARALVYRPRILLMDEPLSALDKKLREEIQHELRRLHQELDVTIVYVTHDQEEALRLSDRIAVFDQGRIVQVGRGEELYENPGSEFVAGFIGSSNFLNGRIEGGENGRLAIRLGDGSIVSASRGTAGATAGDAVRLMIRPDRLAIHGASGAAGPDRIRGTVADATYLGDTIHYDIEIAERQRLSVRTTSKAAQEKFAPGAEVCVHLAAGDLHVFPARP